MTTLSFQKKSKTQETKERILSLVEIGKLKNGDRLLPEPQLAEKFGVSIITVRRALKELETENSIRRIQGKGTFVTHEAPEQNARPHFIKLLSPIELSHIPENNFFLYEMVRGIKEVLQQGDYEINLMCDFFSKEDSYCQEYISGIIGLMLPPETWEHVMQTVPPHVPMIAIHQVPEFCERPVSGFKVDNRSGGYMAVKHLIGRGHRNIGILLLENSPDVMARYDGYRKALADCNISPSASLTVRCESQESDMVQAVRQLISANPGMTAIFAPGYYIAKSAITALQLENLRIPQDISLVAYDDPVSGDFEKMNITTVRQPLKEMGRKAARAMISMIEGRETSVSLTFLRPALVARNSVSEPANA
ncbi:MAG: GntR family transcriptional regulator [Victivallaceae bacterium]|nr:GntR family transcriptional regulator [Victivallaceae bacterium]